MKVQYMASSTVVFRCFLQLVTPKEVFLFAGTVNIPSLLAMHFVITLNMLHALVSTDCRRCHPSLTDIRSQLVPLISTCDPGESLLDRAQADYLRWHCILCGKHMMRFQDMTRHLTLDHNALATESTGLYQHWRAHLAAFVTPATPPIIIVTWPRCAPVLQVGRTLHHVNRPPGPVDLLHEWKHLWDQLQFHFRSSATKCVCVYHLC